jgi:hypothetical protein
MSYDLEPNGLIVSVPEASVGDHRAPFMSDGMGRDTHKGYEDFHSR